MKRSGMLEIMFKCAEDHDGFVGCNIHFVNEALLSVIEAVGMLPPPERFEEVTSYLGYAYYSNVVPDVDGNVDIIRSQLWETENE